MAEVFWVGTAFVAGLTAKAVGLPTLVGYLLAGLMLAVFGVSATNTLLTIGDFGVVFLLFTVGLHIRLKNVLRPEVLGVGSLHLLLSAALFTAVFSALGHGGFGGFLLAVGLGFSSTVLTAKTLEARNELTAYHGRIAIGVLILQDIVAVALLAFTGTENPTIWAMGLLLLPLLRPALIWLLELSGRDELLLLFGLMLAFGIGLLFEQVGLSSKLGALAAGVLLAGHERADELYDKLWGLKEIFLVGFFLQVGLTGLPSMQGVFTAVLLLLLLPIKVILFYLLFVAFRLQARTAFMTTISLSAYSEFALVVGAAAASARLIPADLVIVVALLVALSFTLNAPLSKAANRIWAQHEPLLLRLERSSDHPDRPLRSLGSADYLIIGMGRAGTAAYDFLREYEERPLGIEIDPAQIEQQLEEGRRVVYADTQDPEVWHDVQFDNIRGVLLAAPNIRSKVRATNVLREAGYKGPILALVRQRNDDAILNEMGIQTVALPLVEAGRQLAEDTLRTVTEERFRKETAVSSEPVIA